MNDYPSTNGDFKGGISMRMGVNEMMVQPDRRVLFSLSALPDAGNTVPAVQNKPKPGMRSSIPSGSPAPASRVNCILWNEKCYQKFTGLVTV